MSFFPQEAPAQAAQAAQDAPYDSVWAVPTAAQGPLEQVMLAHDKIYVVLAVVLIIWLGLMFFLFRTDRKLDALERSLADGIPEEPDAL